MFAFGWQGGPTRHSRFRRIMDPSWFAPIDSYCERTDTTFWSEPLNAVSNGAFLAAAVAAFVLWRKAGGRDWAALWLILVTAVVGLGSFLFHTFANRWSLLTDVLPIAVFIYSFFLVAMRRFLGLGASVAVAATAGFLAFNRQFDRLWFGLLPGVTLNGSVGYLPAAGALLVTGVLCALRGRRLGSGRVRRAGHALLAASAVFALSLVFRSIDREVCAALPVGTHSLWHGLNAVVLLMLIRAVIRFDTDGRAHAKC
jgi:hypothetical protein